MKTKFKTAGEFDEGAAQVRRLLDRDRKDIDLDAVEKAFSDTSPGRAESASGKEAQPPAGSDGQKRTAVTTRADGESGSKSSGRSPFGSPVVSGSKPTSPFADIAPSKDSSMKKSPFAEPPDLRELESRGFGSNESSNTSPWWSQITLFQIAIVLSFTLIISSMIATFFFVVNVGGVHFNE